MQYYAVARNYGENTPPALNVLSGWLAWEVFCECVKTRRPINVQLVDTSNGFFRASYHYDKNLQRDIFADF